LVSTEQLLDDAEAVVESLADSDLALAWRTAIDDLVVLVAQPAGDHPALAAAYRGNAAHVISLDDRLTSVAAGANLKGTLEASVRSPEAFRSVVDPATLHELAFDVPYPGPDREPRA
jgi:hypothetical protein